MSGEVSMPTEFAIDGTRIREDSSIGSSAPIQILVVDDEPAVRAVLRGGLEAEGFIVSEAGDKGGLFHALETQPIKLITLDLGFSNCDGLDLARQIRAKRNVPIVMVTGRSESVDRVKGLEHGADDYISKPFHIREVVLRIHAVLRRYQPGAAGLNADPEPPIERYEFGSGILNVPRRELSTVDGVQVDLTETEFWLLAMFVRHPGRVLARDEISQELRGRGWTPLDRTIDGHVARLRRKIEPPSDAPMLIKSVRGVGYVFTGEVRPA
jgi:two-component system OmpR family response regulator